MIVIPEVIVAAVRGHAEKAYPEECCGILLGKDAGTVRRIERAVPAGNIAGERLRDRFAIDPRAIIAAERAAAGEGWDIVGYYHSHPDTAAHPSATDLAAAWEVYSYVIVSVRAGVAREMASFRLEGGRFVSEAVTGDAAGDDAG